MEKSYIATCNRNFKN